jgi:hypothetical protein
VPEELIEAYRARVGALTPGQKRALSVTPPSGSPQLWPGATQWDWLGRDQGFRTWLRVYCISPRFGMWFRVPRIPLDTTVSLGLEDGLEPLARAITSPSSGGRPTRAADDPVSLARLTFQADIQQQSVASLAHFMAERTVRHHVKAGRALLHKLGAIPWLAWEDGQLPPKWWEMSNVGGMAALWRLETQWAEDFGGAMSSAIAPSLRWLVGDPPHAGDEPYIDAIEQEFERRRKAAVQKERWGRSL